MACLLKYAHADMTTRAYERGYKKYIVPARWWGPGDEDTQAKFFTDQAQNYQ